MIPQNVPRSPAASLTQYLMAQNVSLDALSGSEDDRQVSLGSSSGEGVEPKVANTPVEPLQKPTTLADRLKKRASDVKTYTSIK